MQTPLTRPVEDSPSRRKTRWSKRRGPTLPFSFVSLMAVVLMVVAACGGGGGSDEGPRPEPTSTPVPRDTPTARPQDQGGDTVLVDLPIEDFPIIVYQGQEIVGDGEIRLASLFTQGKPVVLNFWAGLCPPCRAEMPDLQEIYDEFKGRVLLFGVDVGVFTDLGTQEDGRELLEELEVSYPAGAATTNVVRSYRVFNMPTTLFITPQGEINDRWNGLLTSGKMRELVEELLEASGA